jgi:hypothetical protein
MPDKRDCFQLSITNNRDCNVGAEVSGHILLAFNHPSQTTVIAMDSVWVLKDLELCFQPSITNNGDCDQK